MQISSFLYTSSKRKRKIITFAIAIKKETKRYIGIKLNKDVKHLTMKIIEH
jgi:hypothetical protein